MKKKSLNDIATELGVSKTLVSFVLNGRGDEKSISKKTQERVLLLAEKYNFSPNFMARGLRMGKTHTIGLIVADISNKFYAKIAKEVEKVAAQNNYNVIFCSSDECVDKEKELIQILRNRQIDGLIISTTQKDSSFFTQMKKENFPFVLIDRKLPRIKANYVGSDNFQGAYDATSHLITNDYANIGLLKISPNYLSSIKEREQGYRAALKENGIRLNANWIFTIPFEKMQESVDQYFDRLLSQSNSIDAVFTINNSIAIACLDYFNRHHHHIPNDVAILSFDDIELFKFSCPNITAIAQPVEDIGRQAVQLLLSDMNGVSHTKQEYKLAVSLIERNSTRKINHLFEKNNDKK